MQARGGSDADGARRRRGAQLGSSGRCAAAGWRREQQVPSAPCPPFPRSPGSGACGGPGEERGTTGASASGVAMAWAGPDRAWRAGTLRIYPPAPPQGRGPLGRPEPRGMAREVGRAPAAGRWRPRPPRGTPARLGGERRQLEPGAGWPRAAAWLRRESLSPCEGGREGGRGSGRCGLPGPVFVRGRVWTAQRSRRGRLMPKLALCEPSRV